MLSEAEREKLSDLLQLFVRDLGFLRKVFVILERISNLLIIFGQVQVLHFSVSPV